MEITPNRFISVSYDLYDSDKDLVEKATKDRPFQFISGLGNTIDAFEEKVKGLKPGDKFEFTIKAEDAYGEYNNEHVLDLPKNVFEIDGEFDTERIFEGNVVPLMNAEGSQMNAVVVEVKDNVVVVDLNHPLAGEDLTFSGEVLESHIATDEEIRDMVNTAGGNGGCGCGGGGCGCGESGYDEELSDENCGDSCGCGHCH